MDLHYKREVTVGGLVLAAIVLFVVGALWLSGKSVGGVGDLTTIEFTQVGNLKEGVPVLISGVNKGKVEQIRLIEPGLVRVLIGLEDDVVPKSDAGARIVSISALGDVAIAFDPGRSSVPLGDVRIKGITEPALTDRVATLGDRADSVLLGAQQLVSQRTADDLHATMVAMQRMLNTLADRIPASTSEATRTMAAFRELSVRLDSTLASPGLTRGLANLDTVTASLATMTTQLTRTGATLDTLLSAMNRGEGTLGKFASDTGLYVDMRGTLQSLKALIDDIKRDPGRITVQLKVF
jgi:phospholipid/cholesterol/gamma-HCH transport system substrate-binding protein